jgi:molybdopterin-guanine dinucleotide biosynthesis protein A
LPCDGPFINREYFEVLLSYRSNKSIQVIKTGSRLQPVYACIDSYLVNNLEVFLQSGERKIDKWYTSCGFDEVLFNHNNEMFLNINSKEDIEINKDLIKKLYG